MLFQYLRSVRASFESSLRNNSILIFDKPCGYFSTKTLDKPRAEFFSFNRFFFDQELTIQVFFLAAVIIKARYREV